MICLFYFEECHPLSCLFVLPVWVCSPASPVSPPSPAVSCPFHKSCMYFISGLILVCCASKSFVCISAPHLIRSWHTEVIAYMWTYSLYMFVHISTIKQCSKSVRLSYFISTHTRSSNHVYYQGGKGRCDYAFLRDCIYFNWTAMTLNSFWFF